MVCGLALIILLLLSTGGIREGIVNNNPLDIIGMFILSFIVWGLISLYTIQKIVWRRGSTRNQVMLAISISFLIVSTFFVRFYSTANRKPKLNAEYWERVAQACQGNKITDAAFYNDKSHLHHIVAVAEGKEIWYSRMPLEWLPESISTTELIVCVGEKELYTIEICRYVGGSDIARYGYKREIKLIAAQTNEVIALETFSGEPPRKCKLHELPTVTKLYGDDVGFYHVENWLSAYVDPW